VNSVFNESVPQESKAKERILDERKLKEHGVAHQP
jgi:hypothetical protein